MFREQRFYKSIRQTHSWPERIGLINCQPWTKRPKAGIRHSRLPRARTKKKNKKTKNTTTKKKK